jgi:glycerate kinase
MSEPVVVIAPDKFKGTLSAMQVATALDDGMRAAGTGVDTRLLPIADGGDGSIDAAGRAGFSLRQVPVTRALGEPAQARIGIRGDTAVVELAEVCGLSHLPVGQRDALRASSFGFGQAVWAALGLGVSTVVLAVGGSASTDGGVGFLEALGGRFLDASGEPISRGAGGLLQLARVDLSGLDPRLRGTRVVMACDVDNPLVGERGAARTYGPQKGASPTDVDQLEKALSHLVLRVCAVAGADLPPGMDPARLAQVPGAGAAGGLGFGAQLIGAQMHSGAELFLDLLGFDRALSGADLMVTGEGSLDSQSLSGKAPVVAAARAARSGVTAVGVAGRCTLPRSSWADARLSAVHTLQELDPTCVTDPELSIRLLRDIGRRLAMARLPRGPEGLATQVAGT